MNGGLGQAVAIDGEMALVGAALTDDGFLFGAVYSFVWDGADWVPDAEIMGTSFIDQVGYAMALEGDVAVIGGADTISPFGPRGSGVAVYERSGSSWALVQQLVPPAGTLAPVIGTTVDISGDRIVVGGGLEYVGVSQKYAEAFVYRHTPAGWEAEARLLPEPEYGVSNFGIDVAIDGDRIAVAAPGDYFVSVATPSVYVFEREGASWVQQARLLDDGIGGAVVAISGETVVTAASLTFQPTQTSVYTDTGTSWALQQALPAEALSVALEDDVIALGGIGGSPSSEVQIFERSNGQWFDRRPFRAHDSNASDGFGLQSVALDDGRLIVGAPGVQIAGAIFAGAAYVFEREVARAYCTTTLNSTGGAARLFAESCPSILQNSLVLHAESVPNTLGVFVYGDSARQVPFGAGTRCVGGAVFRSPVTRAEANRLAWNVDYDHPNPLGRIVAGSNWYFQAWFRDAPGAVNTTEGLEISFLP